LIATGVKPDLQGERRLPNTSDPSPESQKIVIWIIGRSPGFSLCWRLPILSEYFEMKQWRLIVSKQNVNYSCGDSSGINLHFTGIPF